MTDIHRISRGLALKLFSTVTGVGIGLLISVILNRYYGKHDYGVLVLVFTATSLFFSVCNLGAISTLNRFLPQYLKSGDNKSATQLLACSAAVQITGIFISCIVLFFSSGFIAAHIFNKPEFEIMFKIGVLYFLGVSSSNFIFYAFQSLQDWLKEALFQIAYMALYLLLTCVFIFLFKQKIECVFLANFLAACIIVLFGCFSFPKSIFCGLTWTEAWEPAAFNKNIKDIFGFGFPILFVSLSFYFLMWSDKAILGRYVSPSKLALYFIGFNFFNGMMILLKSLYSVFMPYAAELPVSDDDVLRGKFKIIFDIFLYISILSAMVSFFWIEPIINALYGKDYAASIFIFRLLLIVYFFRGIANPMGIFAQNVFNRAKKYSFLCAMTGIYSTIFSLFLIPKFDYYGAVLANICAYIIFSITFILSMKEIRRLLPFGTFIKSVLLLLPVAVTYVFINSFLHIGCVAWGILSPVLYVIFMKISGELSQKNIGLAKESLRAIIKFKKSEPVCIDDEVI